MFKERIRDWLGIKEENERLSNRISLLELELKKTNNTIDNMQKDINSIVEDIKELRNELTMAIQQLNNEKVSESDILHITEKIKDIEDRLNTLSVVSDVQSTLTVSSDSNNIKESILQLIESGNEYNVSDMIRILNVSNYKFYKALSELEKEKKVKKTKKGNKIILELKA
jgi:predicted  nucleic acid-binding Zn-ribbon protein